MNKISEMILAEPLTGSELIEVVQQGTNKRVRISDLTTPGKSAYNIAVKAGYVGTEAAWLATLHGAKGDKGDTGSTGSPGMQGDTGLKGDKGDQGPIGLTGEQGPRGPTGLQGTPGIDGVAGPQGVAGDFGAVGLKGDKGDTGEAGPIGPAGDATLVTTNIIEQGNSSLAVTDDGDVAKLELLLNDKVLMSIDKDKVDFRKRSSNSGAWFANLGEVNGGSNIEAGSAVVIDSQENTIAVGSDDDSGSGIVVKFSPNGTVLWQMDLNAVESFLRADTICVDVNDNIYISIRKTSYYGLIIKLSPNGDILWRVRTSVTAYIIKTDNAQNLIGFGMPGEDGSANIIKLTPDGVVLWNQNISTTEMIEGNEQYGNYEPTDIAIDASNAIYLMGVREQNSTSTVAIKLTSAGVLVWSKKIYMVSENDETPYVDHYGCVLVGGFLYASGSTSFGTPMVTKIDCATGAVVWNKFVNVGIDYSYPIAIDFDATSNRLFILLAYSSSEAGTPAARSFMGSNYLDEIPAFSMDLDGNALNGYQIGSDKDDQNWYFGGHAALKAKNGYISVTGNTEATGTLDNMFVARIPTTDEAYGQYGLFHVLPFDVSVYPEQPTLTVEDYSPILSDYTLELLEDSNFEVMPGTYPIEMSFKGVLTHLYASIATLEQLNVKKLKTPLLQLENSNVGVGVEALGSVTSGMHNIGIGTNAGKEITYSSNNVYLGGYDGYDHAHLDNQVLISDGAGHIRIEIDEDGDMNIRGSLKINGQEFAGGADGKSAYQSAVDNGFVGTEAEWVESMKPAGQAGVVVVSHNFIASETLEEGMIVNIWNNGGSPRVRRADASMEGRHAHGFITAFAASGSVVTVYFAGVNDKCVDLVIGDQYLSVTPGITSPFTPNMSVHVLQTIGLAISDTTLFFNPSDAAILA